MRDYLVNCKNESNREHDAKLFGAAEPFEVVDIEEYFKHGGGSGNLSHEIRIVRKTHKAEFGKIDLNAEHKEKYAALYEAIPSALLMYRLACLFAGKMHIEGRDGYKVVWQLPLKHKKTGEYIAFGEWKGGALFWTKFGSKKQAPESLSKDLLSLLNALLSKKSPHPYDGLVSGGVA